MLSNLPESRSTNYHAPLNLFNLLPLLFLSLILPPSLSMASCYLPEPGQYKFFSSFSFIDRHSVHIKEQREKIYVDAHKMIYRLEEQKRDLHDELHNQWREPTNNERKQLKAIDMEIKELTAIYSEQKSWLDDKMSNMMIEYGINDKYSFGMKFLYRINKFLPDAPRSKNIIARDADVFVKYKIAGNKNWTITLQPKLSVASYGNFGNKFSRELGLIVGHSDETKEKIVRFSEVGVFFGRCGSKKCDYNNSNDFTLVQGVKLKNGLIFYNFMQYSIRDTDSRVYRRSMYEQISIAKEIIFDKLELSNFTISAGYFFNKSLVNEQSRLSGPIFSLWFSI